MSRSYISAELRRFVIDRAGSICEYCLIHEDDTHFGGHVDHIISEKHGGSTTGDNLAFACSFCNRLKGSDIGSIEWETGDFVRFYNPRLDVWEAHFILEGDEIVPLTPIGAVTVRILQLNATDRLLERRELREIGRYPPS